MKDANKSARTEYLVNGDFADGKLEPWKVVKQPVDVVQDDEGYAVSFGRDAKLSQDWQMPEGPSRLTFKMDIWVDGGSDEATGQVQVLFFFQVGSQPPFSATYNIKEASGWETLQLPLSVSSRPTHGTVELLVQPGFDNPVVMRNFSVTDNATGQEVDIQGFKSVTSGA